MSSISGLGEQTKPNASDENNTQPISTDNTQSENKTVNESNDTVDQSNVTNDSKSVTNVVEAVVETTVLNEETQPSESVTVVKACEDIRYKKYFKMVQFGVPAPAVKQKMEAEGFDSSILE